MRIRKGDPKGQGVWRERLLPSILLLGILLAGSWLRLVDLGEAHFTGDELDHYYAALSLEREGAPLLPSGNEYRRGLDITRLVGLASEVVEDPETAARLPSALFGILALVLFAAIGWRIGGPWAGVWAALLLAIYPEAVLQSRQTRFYTYQLCFGLLALYAGWRVVDPHSSDPPSRRWLWVAGALLAFTLALRVQVTTFSVLMGWGVCLLLFAARDLKRHGRAALRCSVPLAVASIGALAGLSFLVAMPHEVARLLRMATHVPVWAGDGGDVRAYYWAFSQNLPVLLALAPLAYLAVAMRSAALAVYLGVWFVVPLLIHSLLLPWKAERYILLATPAFLLASALAATAGSRALTTRVAAYLQRAGGMRPGRAARLAGLATFAVAAFAIVTSRPFNTSRNLPSPREPQDWSEALRIVEAEGLEDAPRGASQPLVPLYYWGRLDFVVGVDFLENRGGGDSVLRPEGSEDWYGGLPVLTRPESIRSRFGGRGPIVLGIERGRWNHGNISPALKAVLETEARDLCDGRCGALLLFAWDPGVDGAAPIALSAAPPGPREPDDAPR